MLDCVPFFQFSTILEKLKKHVNQDRATRQTLVLNELFRLLDQSDSVEKQETDIADIQKLLPGVSKDSITEKIIEIGNVPQRKSFVTKVLLARDDSRKRYGGFDYAEGSQSKVLRIGNREDANVGSKPSTSQSVNVKKEISEDKYGDLLELMNNGLQTSDGELSTDEDEMSSVEGKLSIMSNPFLQCSVNYVKNI